MIKRSIYRPPYKKKENRSSENVTEKMGSRFIRRMKEFAAIRARLWLASSDDDFPPHRASSLYLSVPMAVSRLCLTFGLV
jgi:hypothetical protein